MSKLNDQYFETKRIHKKNYTRKKLILKRAVLNLIIFFLILAISSFLQKDCSNRIKENELKKENINIAPATQNL